MGGMVKFPSVGAERMHSVEAGLFSLRERMAKLEKYAVLIPHKRKDDSASPSRMAASDTVKLHLVVGDVKFNVATGAKAVR